MSTIYDDKKELISMYKEKGLEKGSVIDVVGDFVIDYNFINILDGFLKEYVERRNYAGVVYSDEFDVGDDGYFGENKVLFYYGVDDECHDIVTYKELCDYLEVACEFYLKRNSEKKEIVEKYLSKIREKYGFK